jgi:hypothetical protein
MITLTAEQNLLRVLLGLGLQMRMCRRCGEAVVDVPIATALDATYGSDLCPACHAQARTDAEDGAIDIAYRVRTIEDEVARMRAIEHLTSWDMRVHSHAARVHMPRSSGPSTLAETQELEVV